MTAPDVSILIANCNGRRHLESCLPSLDSLEYPRDRVEVVLVDNGSSDDSVPWTREHFPATRIVQFPRNLGFAPAYNRAATTARGEFLAFLNNDTRVDPGWLRALVDTAERERAASVGSLILNWDGTAVDFAGGVTSLVGHAWSDHENQRSENLGELNRDLLFACAGSMLVRRNAWDEVGGFDADYFAYFEDVDLGWRLSLLGNRVVLAPEAITYHRLHGTSGGWAFSPRLRLYERNALFTIYKCLEDEHLERVLPAAVALTLARGLRYSSLPPERYAFGRPTPDVVPVAPQTIATLLAIEEFGTSLPALRGKREAVQRTRRVSDENLWPLFRDALRIHALGDPYESIARTLYETFELNEVVEKGGRRKAEGPGREPEGHGGAQERHGEAQEGHGEARERHGEARERHGEARERHGEARERHGEAQERHGEAGDRQGGGRGGNVAERAIGGDNRQGIETRGAGQRSAVGDGGTNPSCTPTASVDAEPAARGVHQGYARGRHPALAAEDDASTHQALTPAPFVSVIVLTALGPKHLPACLDSLAGQTYPADKLEILVVDNGSAVDPTECVGQHAPAARVIRLASNTGFCAGNNAGAREARGDLLVFLNDDTRADAHFIEALVDSAARHTADAVGALILSWDGKRIDFAGGGMNFHGKGFQTDVDSADLDRFRTEHPILFACGAAMLIRRDLFLELGGFDEELFAYYEDLALGWQVWLRGGEVWFAPRAIVYHLHHGTSREWKGSARLCYERNALINIFTLYEASTLKRLFPVAVILAVERALMAAGLATVALEHKIPRASKLRRFYWRLKPRAVGRLIKGELSGHGARWNLGLLGSLRAVGAGGLVKTAGALVRFLFTDTQARLLVRWQHFIERGAQERSFDARPEEVSCTSGAILTALGEFVHRLPALAAARGGIQQARTRTDEEIVRLFPRHWLDSDVTGQQWDYERLEASLAGAFGLGTVPPPEKTARRGPGGA